MSLPKVQMAPGEDVSAPDGGALQPQDATPEHDAKPEVEPEPNALDRHSRNLLGQLYHDVMARLEIREQEPTDERRWIHQVCAELNACSERRDRLLAQPTVELVKDALTKVLRPLLDERRIPLRASSSP